MYEFKDHSYLTQAQLDIISKNYDVAINSDVRNFSFKLLINGSIYGEKGSSAVMIDEDSGEIIKTNDERVGSIKFEHDLGMEDWTIGQTPYGKLTVTLRTEGYTGIYSKGDVLEPIILLACNNHLGSLEWVEVPYGVYYVDNIEVNPTYTTLTAYDKMYEFQTSSLDSKVEYPTTVGVALDELFTNEDTSDFDPYKNYVLRRPIEYIDPDEVENGEEDENDEMLPDDNEDLDEEYPSDEGTELPDNENGCCDCPDDCCGDGSGGGDGPGDGPGGGDVPDPEDPDLIKYYWGTKFFAKDVDNWNVLKNGGGIYTGCKSFGPTMHGTATSISFGPITDASGDTYIQKGAKLNQMYYNGDSGISKYAPYAYPEAVRSCESLATQYIGITIKSVHGISNSQLKGILAYGFDHKGDPDYFSFENGYEHTVIAEVGVGSTFYLPNFFLGIGTGSMALSYGMESFNFIIDASNIDEYDHPEISIDFDVTYYGYKGHIVSDKHDLHKYYPTENQMFPPFLTKFTEIDEDFYPIGDEFYHIPGCGSDIHRDDRDTYGIDTASLSISSFRTMSDEEVSDIDTPADEFDGKILDTSPKKLGEGMTKAQLLGYIAGICGGNCYFGHKGEPKLLKLKYDNVKKEPIYNKKLLEDQIAAPAQLSIGRAQCGAIYCSISENEADDIETIMSNNGNYTISIFNPFMTQDYLNKAGDDMNGFSYYPMSVRVQGDPRLWVGDCLYMPQYPPKDDGTQEVDSPIIIEEGVYPIMSMVGSFDMGFGYEIESNCKSDSQREDGYQGTLTDRVSAVENTANKASSSVSILKSKMDKVEALVGYINQLFAIEVNANSVVTGTLNTEKVKIKSGEGEGLIIDGDSIDFVDRNKVNRIHMGSDNNQGDYVIKMTNDKGYTRIFTPSSGDLTTDSNIKDLNNTNKASISSFNIDDKDALIMDLLRRVEELEKRINEE